MQFFDPDGWKAWGACTIGGGVAGGIVKVAGQCFATWGWTSSPSKWVILSCDPNHFHYFTNVWIKKKGGVQYDLSDSIYHITTFDEKLLNFDYNRDYPVYQYKPMSFQWAGENQENYRPNLTALIKLVK